MEINSYSDYESIALIWDRETSGEGLASAFLSLHKFRCDAFTKSTYDKYMTNLIHHPNVPYDVIAEWIHEYADIDLAQSLANNYDTPAVILESLVQYGENGSILWEFIGTNPNTPRKVLEFLDKEGYGKTLMDNPSLAGDIQFASRDDLEIEQLIVLSESPFGGIREIIAENIKTPIATLEKLAQDRYWRVRAAISAHPHTPGFILAKLADDRDLADEDCQIPLNVACNRSTPIAILKELTSYKWEGRFIAEICIAATKNLNSQ
jgi:hypothetical protein